MNVFDFNPCSICCCGVLVAVTGARQSVGWLIPPNTHTQPFVVRSRFGNLPAQHAVVELFLMGKANIAFTSPKSAFSALGAAAGGKSTQRVGETSTFAAGVVHNKCMHTHRRVFQQLAERYVATCSVPPVVSNVMSRDDRRDIVQTCRQRAGVPYAGVRHGRMGPRLYQVAPRLPRHHGQQSGALH